MNLYTYTLSNPLIFVDPTGHEAALDWTQFQREALREIDGGLKGASKGKKSGGWAGTVTGFIVGGLLNPTPDGDTQQYINTRNANESKLPIISLDKAKQYDKDKTGKYVFRALNKQYVTTLRGGKGILSKHKIPNTEWSLLEHITYTAPKSGKDESIGADPWIATTRSLVYANKLNAEGLQRGIVVIDITKTTSRKVNPFYEFDGINDFAASLAFGEEELSFYKYIKWGIYHEYGMY